MIRFTLSSEKGQAILESLLGLLVLMLGVGLTAAICFQSLRNLRHRYIAEEYLVCRKSIKTKADCEWQLQKAFTKLGQGQNKVHFKRKSNDRVSITDRWKPFQEKEIELHLQEDSPLSFK